MYGVLVNEAGVNLIRPRANVIERAYQLARTGFPRRIEDVIAALDREGYTNARAHLEGPAIRHSLRKIWSRARSDGEKL